MGDKKKKEKSEVSEAGGKKKRDKSESEVGKKKKKEKSEASDAVSARKSKRKTEKSEKVDVKKEKKKKKKEESDSEISSVHVHPEVNRIDRLRKSQFFREEKLKRLRDENATAEEVCEEMFKEDIDEEIEDLEAELKKLKKTVEKQKKNSKLPPEAQLQMQNDWLIIQVREWNFKIDNLGSKFDLVKKAHQNAVNSLQEAHVLVVNQNEMEEMREALKNKKNDLFEATQLIGELQKVAWSMLPPKVGKHCQEVEEKMIHFRKRMDEINYEMYKVKMEKASYAKEIKALNTAITGESELVAILKKKFDLQKAELVKLNQKKTELEDAITNGYNLLESAGITYEDALIKAQTAQPEKPPTPPPAPAPAPPPPPPPAEEDKKKSIKKEKKEKKKSKKDPEEKKKKKEEKKKDEDSDESGGDDKNKKNNAANLEEKTKFLEMKLKEIDTEITTVTKEFEKSQKEAQAKMEEIKKFKQLTADCEKGEKDKQAFGLQLQQEVVLRKTYYNQIEDLKGKIRVFSRCRPISKSELERGNTQCVAFPDKYTVAVYGVSKDGKPKEFQFDRVFPPETQQDDIFEDTSRLIQSAFDGFNVCIFGYGQTGSGKTHTLIGNLQHAPGIAPRSFGRLFEVINEGKTKFTAKLTCYMLELYNEKLLDLMASNAEYSDKLEIKRDNHGMVIVPGAELLPARTADELRDLFLKGNGNRHIASTKMNAESSRSHLIISMMIECTQLANGKIIRGKMSIIDLAGSERLAKSGVKGVGATEATAINMSLSALGDVISALTSGQPFIPYRNNKLTLLMQDSLGGNAKTLMFVNLSPVDYNATETVNSLVYAQRVKLIKNDATKVSDTEEIPKLEKLIARLQNGETIDDFHAAMQ